MEQDRSNTESGMNEAELAAAVRAAGEAPDRAAHTDAQHRKGYEKLFGPAPDRIQPEDWRNELEAHLHDEIRLRAEKLPEQERELWRDMAGAEIPAILAIATAYREKAPSVLRPNPELFAETKGAHSTSLFIAAELVSDVQADGPRFDPMKSVARAFRQLVADHGPGLVDMPDARDLGIADPNRTRELRALERDMVADLIQRGLERPHATANGKTFLYHLAESQNFAGQSTSGMAEHAKRADEVFKTLDEVERASVTRQLDLYRFKPNHYTSAHTAAVAYRSYEPSAPSAPRPVPELFGMPLPAFAEAQKSQQRADSLADRPAGRSPGKSSGRER